MPGDLQPPSLDSRPARHPGPAWGGERDLNQVGTRILQLCDGRRTVAQITQALVDELGADPAEARVDVSAFVAQLAEMKVLVLQPPRP